VDVRELQQALEEFIFVGQAHKLGIFQELHRKIDTAIGLSKRMRFDQRCTWVLLEALVEMHYLVKRGDTYVVPDDVYQRLVERGGAHYEGDFWQFLYYLLDPWRTLPHVLQHGTPDESSYEKFSIEDFIRAMDSPWKKRLTPEIVDICLRSIERVERVMDVGGAPGTVAREFANRGIQVVIYDLPESVAVTAEELSSIANIEVLSGDATEDLPAGVYDIAFLGNLCHGQSPEDNVKILHQCHDRLREGGIVVIFENIRGESYLGARLALHMITQSPRGNVYTREEYRGWLDEAGFSGMVITPLSDKSWQLIIASR
jgi:SAM-dependent methyltransferase